MSFDSLSHYLYNKILTTHTQNEDFNFFNVFDWILVLATGAGVFALILVAILHYRVRTVMILLAAGGRAQALPSTQLFTYLPSFSTVSNDVGSLDPMVCHKFVQEIFPVDLTLLFAVIICILAFFGYLFYRLYRARRARTVIVLEFGSATESMQWTIKELTYASYYRIVVNKDNVAVSLRACIFGGKLSWGFAAVSIVNTATEVVVSLPVSVKLSYFVII